MIILDEVNQLQTELQKAQLELEIASRTVQDNIGENGDENSNEINEKIEAAKGRII